MVPTPVRRKVALQIHVTRYFSNLSPVKASALIQVGGLTRTRSAHTHNYPHGFIMKDGWNDFF